MAEAAVAADITQAIDRASREPAQLTFHQVVLIYVTGERCDLPLRQVTCRHPRIQFEVRAHLRSSRPTHSKDVGQGELETLVVGDIYTVDSGHI